MQLKACATTDSVKGIYDGSEGVEENGREDATLAEEQDWELAQANGREKHVCGEMFTVGGWLREWYEEERCEEPGTLRSGAR